MNLDQFTIKAQEAIAEAQQIAIGNGHQAIESGHLLKGILSKDDHVIPYLLKKNNVQVKHLQQILDKQIASYPKVEGGNVYASNNTAKIFEKATSLSKEFGDSYATIEHLFLGILLIKDPVSQLLKDQGLTEKNCKLAIKELRKGATVDSQTAEDTFNALNKYALHLNQMARDGKMDPVIGRDEEIRRVLQILSRRTKNNPILIGEPGVGKTAIAEGLAHRIIEGDVPENLKSKQVYSLDMGALIAGAKYKGEFEERLKSVVKEVINASGDIVLFIDEIHTLVGAGGGEGAMDAANILKPALARGELRAIGATTLDEYQKYFEKDKALERRFQKVLVDEPNREDAISILRGIKEKYETHHKVRIKDEAIISAVELSQRYISDRFLPDKAIDLMDEAASKLRMEINSKPEALDELDRKITQLEIEKEAIKRENDPKKLAYLVEELSNLSEDRNTLQAQWQAEKDIVEGVQKTKEDIENAKLAAEHAERQGDYGQVAEIRYGQLKELDQKLALMMAEMDAHKGTAMIKEEVDSEDIADVVSRWTGIPVNRMLQSEREKLLNLETELHKRVIGQDEAIEAISDAVRRNKAGLQDEKRPIGSFIFLGTTGVGKTELAKALATYLFNDESSMTRIDMSEYQEKHTVSRLIGAPPGYVGYDEGGQLTEAVRRKPYSVILLDEIEKAHPDVFNILLQVLDDGRLTDNKGRTVNFKNTIIIMTSNLGSHVIQDALGDITAKNREKVLAQTQNDVLELLRKTIRPEFLNRIDETIVFTPLSKSELASIVALQLQMLTKRLAKNDIVLDATPAAIAWIAAKGYDPQFGARPVKRVIQREILNQLSKEILAGTVSSDSVILIDIENDALAFKNSTDVTADIN
jgi:ATP-dependent Clp protease ATP-binding subunit ClpB